jgi:hypothetical protein
MALTIAGEKIYAFSGRFLRKFEGTAFAAPSAMHQATTLENCLSILPHLKSKTFSGLK